ncbi:MAG: DNA polymerase [Patescibacteria group bacterium]
MAASRFPYESLLKLGMPSSAGVFIGFLSLISRLPGRQAALLAGNPDSSEGGEAARAGKDIEAGEDAKFLENEKEIWWCNAEEGESIYAASREGRVAVFGGVAEQAAAKKLLQKKVRHHFCGAKKIFHLLSLEAPPEIASDLKVAAWLARPDLQNPTLINLVHAFLPEERLGQSPEVKAFSLLPKLEGEITKEIGAKALTRVMEEIELPLIPVLFEMEKRGILADIKLLARLSKDFGRRLRKVEESIWKLAGASFNIASPKQLSEILFGALGLSAPGLKKTATGARSTRESELVKLKNLHPIVGEFLAFRELAKLKSTYIDALPRLADKEGRVHTTYDQTGTVTGRLSSSEPNLQNIPIRSEFGRAVRGAFIASPGFELVSFDYSQIELRIAAILSGDEKMQRAFKEGRDIHVETASAIFNVPAHDVTDTMRRRAKTINFGILYGMGSSALSQSLEISRSEAERFLEEYFKDFSGMREFLERLKKEAYQNGFVETAHGRRRYLPEIYSKADFIRSEAERMAVNAPIQGTAADIVKLAMIQAQKFIKSEFADGGAYLLLQIHDELLCEVKKERAEDFSLSMKKILESIFTSPVPLTVDAKRGPNWAEMHKSADI